MLMAVVSERPLGIARPAAPPAWRWVHVVVAALAMVATLPGRTHGLGLITEPLLRDLGLDRVDYGAINLWATLLGAAFCVPCGWLIDRLGTRVVLTGVLAALGCVVAVMSQVQGDWLVALPWGQLVFDLFVLVLLTRGLGQSALSVVSLALIGQTAGRRPGLPVGVYSFVSALGFMAAFGAVGFAMKAGYDWRSVWAGIGCALLAYAVLACFLVRPSLSGWGSESEESRAAASSFTLGAALATPAFWIFALATSHYGMIAAGISLFNESILRERGFDVDVFRIITAVTPLIGLASNLATGWLATRVPLGRLLAGAMALLTLALLCFPYVETLGQVYLYAAVMGLAGGMITVLFFAVWGQAFGPAHLGKIQGAAQMLTVFASAGGPLLLALAQREYGSYLPLYRGAAVVSGVFALLAWWTKLPLSDSHHDSRA
jgi:MFS family permease